MKHYSEAAVERMMKVQEVILRALAGKLQGRQAAEILGVSDRTIRRWRWRYQQHGYDGLYDRRKGKPSPQAGTVGDSRESVAAVPTGICGSQHAAGIFIRS